MKYILYWFPYLLISLVINFLIYLFFLEFPIETFIIIFTIGCVLLLRGKK
jgi:hypothetical protein